MATRYFGAPIPRNEDRRLLRGQALFVDDVELPGMLHAAFLRSNRAHARIRAIDTAAAAGAPGVIAVLTGADLARDGIGTVPCVSALQNRDGSTMKLPLRPALVTERVRHVGDAVAVVVSRPQMRACA